jgi:hypothetical protein
MITQPLIPQSQLDPAYFDWLYLHAAVGVQQAYPTHLSARSPSSPACCSAAVHADTHAASACILGQHSSSAGSWPSAAHCSSHTACVAAAEAISAFWGCCSTSRAIKARHSSCMACRHTPACDQGCEGPVCWVRGPVRMHSCCTLDACPPSTHTEMHSLQLSKQTRHQPGKT